MISTACISVFAAWFVFAAVSAQGYVRTKLDLQDQGVWLTRGTERSVGYLSKFSNRLELKFPVPQLGLATLSQADASLTLDDPAADRALVVSSRTAKTLVKLENLAKDSQVDHRGDTVSLLDPVKGTVRTAEAVDASSLAGEGPATFTAAADPRQPATQAVGVDGAVHVLSTVDGAVTTLRSGQAPKPRGKVANVVAGRVQLSAAGSTPVVLDTAKETLSVPGRSPIKLGSHGATLVLQQPSDDDEVVLVASETELVAVDLDGGKVKVLATDGTGDPIPPVRYRGNSFAAWQAQRYGFRLDKADKKIVYDRSGVASKTLRWQVGRGMVALSDALSGDTFFLTEDDEVKKVVVEDWQNALQKDEDQQQDEDGTDTGQTQVVEEVRRAEQVKPEPEDDTDYGTRAGRPAVVPVLLNDRDANGDVLVVTKVGDVQAGTAGVVADGTGVQFAPAGTQAGGFTYTVSDGLDTAEARGTVKVFPADGSGNQPPRKQQRRANQGADTLVAAVGAPVEGNVLRGWFDPEGDAFTLADQPTFDPPDAAGWFTVDPDGRLTGRPFAAGQVTTAFRVVDEFGAVAETKVVIDVAQEAKAKTYPDTAYVRPGETKVVDVLANDVGADLRVGKTTPPGPRVRAEGTDGNRKVSVRAEEPGEYVVKYQAKVNGSPDEGSEGVLRLVVPKSGDGAANLAPVAAVDTALAKPGVPVTVDVLRNDADPNADVLVVTDAAGDGSSEVQVIDNRFVRIQVTSFPPAGPPPVVRYNVSDGNATAEGLIRVLRDPFGGDRPPLLRDDYRNVRAGSVLRVPVLENDSDADSALRLATANPIRPGRGEGQWLPNGDEAVFVAPSVEGRATATYRVEGSTAEATVNVTVTRLENGGNVTLERMPDVTVRAVSGQDIRVSLPLSADPDGDPLRLTGQFNPSARPLGTVVASPTDIEAGVVVYRAESTKSGLDSFTYEVEELFGDRQRVTGTVWVGVAKPTAAEAPVAYPDLVYAKIGETRTIDVLRNDSPPGKVELVKVDPLAPAFGTTGIDPANARRIVYAAPTGGAQTVEFRYEAGLRGVTSTGKVTVMVVADRPNLPPVVTSGRVALAPGQAGAYPALARSYDPDGDRAGLRLSVDPRSAATGARVEGGSIALDRPERSVTVLFNVADGDGGTTIGFVVFDVENRPPASSWQIPDVDGDVPQDIDIRKLVSDPDGDAWTFKGAGGEANGRIAKTEGEIVTFIANPDTRNAQFIANVVDDKGRTAALTFGFKVRTNRPPAPLAVQLTVPSKGVPKQLTIDPNDVDETDVGSHRIAGDCVVTGPVTIKVSQPLMVEVGSEALKGATGQVTCTVEDSRNKQGKAIINVTVGGTDRPAPSAQPIEFSLEQGEKGGQPKTEEARFTDPLGLGVDIRPFATGGPVKLAASGTRITATPPASGFSGQVDLDYTVVDREGREATAALKVLVKGVPRPPSVPKVTAGDKTVTVEWNAPAPNGVPVDSYKVASSGGQSKDKETGTSTTFTGLENGRSYTFQVTACHQEWGCSQASPASDAAVPDSPPGTPQGFLAVREDSQVKLTWQAPADSGGTAISGYEVDCPGCGRTQAVGAGQTTYTWTGLTNGTTYAFSLVAVKILKSTGKIAKSDPTSQSAKPAGPPGAPPSVTAARDDSARNGDVRVSWAASDPNGDPITDYQVRVIDNASATCAVNVSGRNAVCTGLTRGASVQVGVKGVNRSGVGGADVAGAERPSGPVVPAAKPGKPEITGIQGQGSTATLTWTQPDNGGVPITNFRIYRNGTFLQNVGAATSATVDTPVPGNYTFTVDATNAANYTSDQSSQSRPVKGQGVPTISFSAANVGGNVIRFSWSVGENSADSVSVQLSGVGPASLVGSWDEDIGCGSSTTRNLTVNYSWDGRGQPARSETRGASTPACGVTLTVYNKLTNGCCAMREDPVPLRLTTLKKPYCTRDGCNINGTEMATGATFVATCYSSGEQQTNGTYAPDSDDGNPERVVSSMYYNGTKNGMNGWASEVWVQASDRGGRGLPLC